MSLAKITELNEKMTAIKEEMRATAKESGTEIIQELFAPLFALGITSATWLQYTPYFNDGDSCEFGVRADEMDLGWPNLKGSVDEDDEDSSAWSALYYLRKEIDSPKRQRLLDAGITVEFATEVDKVASAIGKVLHANEDMLEMAFGDHVKVTVTPNGLEVDEYEHD